MWRDRQQQRTEKGTPQIGKGLSVVDEIRRRNVKKKLQGRNWRKISQNERNQGGKANKKGEIFMNYAVKSLFRIGLAHVSAPLKWKKVS